MVAHEMGSALAPSLNAMEVLKRVGPTAAVADRMLGVIDRSSQLMKAFVGDLSELAEFGPAAARLAVQRVSVAGLLEDASSASADELRRRGLSLQVQLPQQELALDDDPVRLLQVLVNPLLNAAKYMADRGHIELTAVGDVDTVVFRVQDNGIGIGPERLEDIFDLFARGDHPRHLAVGELGLRLAIAKKFVELHGGTVLAPSAGAGHGATFEVRPPLQAARR